MRTYQALKDNSDVKKAIKNFTKKLSRKRSGIERARFVHSKINESLENLFKDEAVQKHVKCKKSCTACCHTQVSVTEDEAALLASHIRNGNVDINWLRLRKQAKAKNIDTSFYKIPYNDRACIFLDQNGGCSVYEDRPSVCRTNYAVSDPKYCETRDGHTLMTRLLKTISSDIMVYAFFKYSRSNGTLPYMVSKELIKDRTKGLSSRLDVESEN